MSVVLRVVALSALAAAAPNATPSACAALAAREFDLLAFTRVMKTGSSSLLASLRESPRYAAARDPLVLEASAREGREFDFVCV